ncbi:hypothetical protein ELY21_11810 [Legionella sp. km535]|uniref:hypothetical protein n=1 Tax=Legionella sp. km535 TaxID=2498107 RepID=UPI000F8C44B7|nr:hypothetical protein [Legionella sp. km535]RUR16935.1 hypothetical protein ELY21_11810 [Legionella sp. km535]
MTQNTPGLSHWFLTDDYRAKAQLKYELKHLESRLHKYLDVPNEQDYCHEEVRIICAQLAQKYLDYLKLRDPQSHYTFNTAGDEIKPINWVEYMSIISQLKARLSKMAAQEEESRLIIEIASLYHQCTVSMTLSSSLNRSTVIEPKGCSDELNQLFLCTHFKSWLSSLVEYWNHSTQYGAEQSVLFRDWNHDELQRALDFFSDPQLVNLVNAIFFYKLFPDKLFNELIHPEKLVSVRMRLGFLHEFIERLQQQLHQVSFQKGLKSGVDYLFHGDDLPQGILIEVDEDYREIIQLAVKNLKVKCSPENEEQVTSERLHDLGRAYKFWFNPNRLIDAVMVLQQRLVSDSVADEEQFSVFHQEMLYLYRQLTTTDCLDLYGYFANKDSRYLLYTLFTIIQDKKLDWLPPLTKSEKNAVASVFNALQCVMEALRVELKNRHVTTEPYVYDLEKQYVQARRRNRDAVFRIIAIYGRDPVTISDSVEKLFDSIEDNN